MSGKNWPDYNVSTIETAFRAARLRSPARDDLLLHQSGGCNRRNTEKSLHAVKIKKKSLNPNAVLVFLLFCLQLFNDFQSCIIFLFLLSEYHHSANYNFLCHVLSLVCFTFTALLPSLLSMVQAL